MMKFIISISSRFIPRHQLQRVAGFVLKIVGIFYRGNRFEDPITGRTYRKLLPYGRIQMRSNALAPDSMSLERHRLIWLYLKDRTNFFTAKNKVLHIAPEYCFIKRFAKLPNLDYITADLNSPWAKVKLDVQNIPMADNEFDVILCNHVLEHVADDIKAMREMFRVMKPGGFGIFQVPLDTNLDVTLEDKTINSPALRELHYGQRDHRRLYGKDYSERLQKAGFIVTEDHYVNSIPSNLVNRYALPQNEAIYLCVKPY